MGGGAETALAGTVRAQAFVSATLPSNIAFTFTPPRSLTLRRKNQADPPPEARATNNLVVPVVLEITQVRVKRRQPPGRNPLEQRPDPEARKPV